MSNDPDPITRFEVPFKAMVVFNPLKTTVSQISDYV